jgi:hypothetical protein
MTTLVKRHRVHALSDGVFNASSTKGGLDRNTNNSMCVVQPIDLTDMRGLSKKVVSITRFRK